ncbi:MAG: hypothetical protein ACKOC5_19310 [Chloroflexota bacterium]
MSPKQARFLPFHAINEFMRDDYRAAVISQVLTNQAALPETNRAALERLTRQTVTVPGFRNSAKAPALVRVRATAEAFTKNPGMAGAVLAAWSELHAELRRQVYDLLTERGWGVYPRDD